MSKEIHDFGIATLEGIVERVNTGPTQGFEHLTSEYLAASYAASAVLESDDMSADGELDAVEYHLELLAEAGATFDAPQAERFALEMVELNCPKIKKFNVLLADGTVGSVSTDTLGGSRPDEFIGEVINVHLHDENGHPIEREGRLEEVLGEAAH
ncbi:MAG TPA: hypothetical protein VKY62_10600 [Devosia sp.]|nr:hypothetical protein [Devosia sp.]